VVAFTHYTSFINSWFTIGVCGEQCHCALCLSDVLKLIMSRPKQHHYKINGVVILVLALLASLINQKYELTHNYFLFGVVSFGFILYSSDTIGERFAKYWMAFGKMLGDINAKIILSFMFFVILTPIALLKKFVSTKRPYKKSTWTDCKESEVDFTKPW
tara:strand:- start:11455 stop:11931 length:477 start_codon:yes stop_codon:yes gene_type:complete